jgi:hypothetical protein
MNSAAPRLSAVSSLFAVFLAAEARSQPYLEQNGQVVIEVEVVPPAGSWDESQAIAGYTGDSYYVWDGPNQSQGGNGLLTYEIRIQSAGNYQILWRSRITEGDDSTEGNDTWVSLSGTPISGQHTIGTNVWTKAYHGQLGKWSWQTATKDFDPQPIRQFFSAGLHTIRLSGRSGGHAVDRFVLFKYADKPYENNHSAAGASQEAALTALPQSPQESDGTTTTSSTTTTTTSTTTTTLGTTSSSTTLPPSTTTTIDTTTTTLPLEACGDPAPFTAAGFAAEPYSGLVTATDALFLLRSSVGLEECLPCVCDVDASGSVSATDALIALQAAVGQPVELTCPPCS